MDANGKLLIDECLSPDLERTWLVDGVGVDRVTVRRFLMEDKSSGRAVSEPVEILLLAAERACERLRVWEQPWGTAIADRMTDLALTEHAA